MNILFLSHYFPPEINAPASRTFEHCREWVRAGHHVTVVTCAPNHPRGIVYPGYRNALVAREVMDGIDVIRLWTFLASNEGFGRRTANYLSFMLACICAIPWLPRSDVVVSTSPQFFNGLAGYFVSRAKRRPWVLEIRDLWPESILALGVIRTRAVIWALRWLENFAYRKCAKLVPVTDAFARYMMERGVPATKIETVTNGVELDLFNGTRSGADLRERLGLRGKIVAAYFGTHGMAHHLETVLEAAAQLTRDSRIAFLLVGDGAERAHLVELMERMRLGNVIMLEQQPKHLMPEFWAMADISLVVLRKADVFKAVIPSKIFEAMAMASPIVLGVEGEAQQIIETAGAGICVQPEDPVALAAAVATLAHDEGYRKEIGRRARDYVSRNFDRRALAARYLALLEAAAIREKWTNDNE